MKKAVSLFCIIIMLCLCIPFPFAEAKNNYITDKDKQYIYYVLEDGTAVLHKYLGKSLNVSIPERIDKIKVSLIGSNIFMDTSNIRSITIPDSVRIETNIFANCRELNNIMVSSEHVQLEVINGVLYDKVRKRLMCLPISLRKKEYTIPEWTKEIGRAAFINNTSLETLDIPDNVEYIEAGAFMSCTSLSSIVLSHNLQTIENQLFVDCDSLEMIIVPEGVKEIGVRAFEGCDNLKTIWLPNSLTKIGEYAFEYCPKLESIHIGIENPVYESIEGILIDKKSREVICYPEGKE